MTVKTKNTIENQTTEAENAVVLSHMGQDLKNSVLIVSLVANLIVLTAWIALQVTTQYDTQLASFIFGQ
jgi:hypothetical protein